MSDNPLLGPVIALVGWTLVVMIWMAIKRFAGFKHHNIDVNRRPGARGPDLDGTVEPHFQWPAHNYMHLLEQPTAFYAIMLVLVALDDRAPLNLTLAWAYVAIRVVHSIWQITVNKVPVRLMLFMASSLCLAALTLHAAIRLWH